MSETEGADGSGLEQKARHIALHDALRHLQREAGRANMPVTARLAGTAALAVLEEARDRIRRSGH